MTTMTIYDKNCWYGNGNYAKTATRHPRTWAGVQRIIKEYNRIPLFWNTHSFDIENPRELQGRRSDCKDYDYYSADNETWY